MGVNLAFELEAVVFPKCNAGACRDGVFRPFELKCVVEVADEDEGGRGAIVGGIGGIGIGEVCEVLWPKR